MASTLSYIECFIKNILIESFYQETKMACIWLDPNHTYFQIANVFLALTYFVPNTLKGLLLLRFFLGTSGFFFSMWAGIILCSPDTLAWNLVFLVVNFAHALFLLYKMRRKTFDEENELVFTILFEPLGVKRWQYEPIASSSVVKEMTDKEHIAIENKTHGVSVSILTSGTARVEKQKKLLNRLKPFDFVDSPEWVSSTQAGGAMPVTYEASIISEGCVIIQWQRMNLLKILQRNDFLKNVFDSLIGRDVTKKLFKGQKMLLRSFKTKKPHIYANLYADSSEQSLTRREEESENDEEGEHDIEEEQTRDESIKLPGRSINGRTINTDIGIVSKKKVDEDVNIYAV